ncbi:MAG: hypothetical protein HC866_19655 [Leptolyngbyaceae cyanobacterium RU_5_1]|nr:hypothetical protein [Leptolyngbyaceae cyanobacterium RU_5_1]
MSSNLHGLSVTKPVSAWNRPLKANFKDLFKALGKAVIDGALGKWDSVAGDVLDASVAVGLGADTGQVAWLLIYRSFQQAMAKLIEDNQELMVKRSITMRKLEDICDRLDLALEEMELRIDSSLFSSPKQLPIVAAMQPPFAQWLTGFVQDSAQALAMSARLPGYFVFALHEEWRIRAKDYECLKTQLDTPFTKATEREQAWWRYLAWLQQQIEQPMFLEAFGLKQVYVPLRAYYIRQQAKFTPEDVAIAP